MKNLNEVEAKGMIYKIAKKLATSYLERHGDKVSEKKSISRKALDKLANTILDDHKAKLYHDAFDQIIKIVKDELRDKVVESKTDDVFVMPSLNEYLNEDKEQYVVIADLKDGKKEIIEYVDSPEEAEQTIENFKEFAGEKFDILYKDIRYVPKEELDIRYLKPYFIDSDWEKEK